MNASLPSAISIELITIGREILDGRIVDTNAVNMAKKLHEKGLVFRHSQRVDDVDEDIVAAFQLAQSRSQFVLVTGGLGPTSDDRTLACFAKFLGKDMLPHPEAKKHLETFLSERNLALTPAQEKQCFFPAGSHTMVNETGTALGCEYKVNNTTFYLMPGVPSEMLPMLEGEVLPKLPGQNYHRYRWATHFVPEAHLQDRLIPIEEKLPQWMDLNFRTRFPENHVALFANCQSAEQEEQFEEQKNKISNLLQEDCFFHGPELNELHEIVIHEALVQNTWLGSVESCTGGRIAAQLSQVAGASGSLFATWTTYHNDAKAQLGVSRELLNKHGAVSAEVAEAMAKAGLEKIRSANSEKNALVVSTTGIAGPTGGSEEKPVGTCYVGLAHSSGQVEVKKIQARKGLTREKYQQFFTQHALNELRRSLQRH